MIFLSFFFCFLLFMSSIICTCNSSYTVHVYMYVHATCTCTCTTIKCYLLQVVCAMSVSSKKRNPFYDNNIDKLRNKLYDVACHLQVASDGVTCTYRHTNVHVHVHTHWTYMHACIHTYMTCVHAYNVHYKVLKLA